MALARRSRVTSTSIALTFTAAIVLSGLHLAGRPIHRLLFMSERVSGSIFGGMAAAYVFLYLLPELETTHDVIGEGIHFVILLGFLLSYGAEHYSYRLRQRSLDAERAASWSFNTRIVSLWIYNALFHLHPTRRARGWRIHVRAQHRRDQPALDPCGLRAQPAGRGPVLPMGALAAAPLTAAAVDPFAAASDALSDVLTAVLAGYMLLAVFKEELLSHERSDFRRFVVGVAVYAVLVSSALFGE